MRRTLLSLSLLAAALPASAQPRSDLPGKAADAAARATAYLRQSVATRGGYLWTYSHDLKTRVGEGDATASQIWVQPPGTPTVGMAFLRLHEATGKTRYLDAAREAAEALAWGQLASGGWDYRIDFDPDASKRWHYRRDVDAGDATTGGRRNTSTFDDDNSQSALRLLMRVDKALALTHPPVRRAVEHALAFFVAAQYPNGAWPQRTTGPADPNTPVRKARYPETWSRTHPHADYHGFYTLNDDTQRDCILTMIEAHEIYGRSEYLAAAKRGGDFLLRARMPEPQPVWAQQYNHDMEPAWARRFEPPSVTGGESAGAIRTLVDLFVVTGDKRYLEPIPAAIAWYRRSRIDATRWARFYELHTNRPLYFTKDYKLVYTDDDLPTHYSFQSPYGVESALGYAERALSEGRSRLLAERRPRRAAIRTRSRAPRVRAIVNALDDQGRWVEAGKINMRTFVANLNSLANYLESNRPPGTGGGASR